MLVGTPTDDTALEAEDRESFFLSFFFFDLEETSDQELLSDRVREKLCQVTLLVLRDMADSA